MSKIRQFLKRSVDNVITHGDTDIFPFPVENLFFHDSSTIVVDLLEDLHKNFDEYSKTYPISQERALQTVGHFGYRWGTQVDPLWNAYLLALILSIADDIESSRIKIDRNIVFSYRYKFDSDKKSLFDKELNWRTFSQKSLEKTEQKKFVLKCDISDFYPRIYHHRIENALQKATRNTEAVRRIVNILSGLSKGVSYGLPVGGPASRLLSELLLNRVDKLLLVTGIDFCRYADDYIIFANSIEEAYANLIILSEKLHENEGLLVQKSKTQIMSVEEFRYASEFSDNTNDEVSDMDREAASFLKLRLFYDPYSPTADSDYQELSEKINEFDIVGMLGREINKSRINQALTRRLISSIKYLPLETQSNAILSIVENFEVLYPVFPSVMILIRAVLDKLDDSIKESIFSSLRKLFNSNSYITKVTVNLAFSIRILAHDKSDETDIILGNIFNDTTNIVIKRDVILAMAQRNADYWISDRLNYYSAMTLWEKRSMLLASFILGDEGSHWRPKVKDSLSTYDQELLNWFCSRFNSSGWGSLL